MIHRYYPSGIILAIMLMCLFTFPASAQDVKFRKTILVTGRTYDMDSLEVLPFVSVMMQSGVGVIADQNGYFELEVHKGDSLEFSHVGYRTSMIALAPGEMEQDTLCLEIFLAREAYELPEATIFPYRDYKDFKRAFMKHKTDQTHADNFSRNIELLMLQLNSNYSPEKDAYSNYRNIMIMKDQNNNAFIFISTEPGKGILPLLKRVIKEE